MAAHAPSPATLPQAAPTLSGLPADSPTMAAMIAEAHAKPGTLRIAPRGDLEILITRAFMAPAAALFDAFTRADLLKGWLGSPDWPLVACEVDVRPGGAYRFEVRSIDGAVMGWGGTYLEMSQQKGFVATERYDVPWFEGKARVKAAFHEEGEVTVASLLLTYESLNARDTVLRSPWDAGLAEGFKRLEGVLRGE